MINIFEDSREKSIEENDEQVSREQDHFVSVAMMRTCCALWGVFSLKIFLLQVIFLVSGITTTLGNQVTMYNGINGTQNPISNFTDRQPPFLAHPSFSLFFMKYMLII